MRLNVWNVSGPVLNMILVFKTICKPIISSDGQLEKSGPTFRKNRLSWSYWCVLVSCRYFPMRYSRVISAIPDFCLITCLQSLSHRQDSTTTVVLNWCIFAKTSVTQLFNSLAYSPVVAYRAESHSVRNV